MGISGTGKTSKLTGDMWEELHTDACASEMLIDTHEDCYNRVAPMCIKLSVPPSEVLFIDPTDAHYGHIVLDPLRIPGVDPYTCVDSLLAVFRGICGSSFGARQEDCLRHTFLTLQAVNLPVSAALSFLENEKMHRLIVSKTNDPELENFWEYFYKYHRADVESSRNRLASFLLNPQIKPLFDSVGSTFDFYDIFNEGEIIACNIARRCFKDESSRGWLCAVLLSMAYNALLRREHDKEKKPVILFCDEIGEYFGNGEFVLPILTGGRKWGAGLRIYTQSLGAFSKPHLEIIFSTVGSIVSFAVGHEDANRLVNEMFSMRNDTHIKHQERDLYGGYGEKKHYSAGELRQHYLEELKNQAQREVFVRIKKRHGNETYIGRVADVPEFTVSPEEEAEYKRESAKHHGYQNPCSLTPAI